MADSTIVSVIIPCYNHAKYLFASVDSVINQTYPNWECIIVNDGSPDHTEIVARELCNKDSRIKYVKKKNGGLADSRNFGIVNSNGKYLLPLDADDKIHPTYLAKAVNVLDNNSVDIVYCDGEYFDEKSGNMKLENFDPEMMLFQNQLFCSALFKRSDFDSTDGFDTSLTAFEDWDFWLSLMEQGKNFYKIPEVLFYYRYKKSSMLRDVEIQKQKELYKYICSKHGSLYKNHLNSISFLLFENFHLKNEVNQIKYSTSYKLGYLLLYPFIKIKDKLLSKT